jgi:hypothetical protein
MAAVLQHQIAGRVNDLNQKMSTHARIIFQLSVELDRIREENDEFKKILKGHKIAIQGLKSDVYSRFDKLDKDELNDNNDIVLKNDLKTAYKEFNPNSLTQVKNNGEEINLNVE